MIARDQLRSYVERVERIEEEVRDLNGDKSDLYKEAKSNGFDVPTLKRVVARRRKDPAEAQEADTLFDLYMHALGMAPAGGAPSRVHAHEDTNPGEAVAASVPAGHSGLPAAGSDRSVRGDRREAGDGTTAPAGRAAEASPATPIRRIVPAPPKDDKSVCEDIPAILRRSA